MYEEFRLTGGLNNKASPDALSDGELQVAWEACYDEVGAVCSRTSRAALFTGLLGEIRGEGDAMLAGTRYRIIKAGFGLFRNETAIGVYLGTGKISVIVYNGYAYIADGTTFRRYTVALGLQAVGYATPTVAPSQSSTATTGGFFKDGIYKWVVTFFNGVAESNFSPEFSKTFAAATDTDTITLTIPLGPDGTIERRIYRTDLNGVSFYRVGKVADNTTTTFEDLGGTPPDADPEAVEGDEETDEPRRTQTTTQVYPRNYPLPQTAKDDYTPEQRGNDIAITNLGILANWTDHDAPPTTIRHLRFLRDRVYGIAGNSLRFTRIAAPEHWSDYNDVPIGKQEGETLMAIEPLGDEMVCYTDAGLWQFRTLGEDATQSTLRRSDSPVGLAAQGAVVDVYVQGGQPAGHLFLARSGIYLFDGRSATEVSTKVEKIFTEPGNFDYVNKDAIATAVAASLRDQVLISYAHAGGGNDRTLFIDLQDPTDIKFAIWRVGFTTLHRDSDNKLIGGTAGGDVYELMVEATTESLTWRIKTKRFPINGATSLEEIETVVVDADLGGLETVMHVENDRLQAVQYTLSGTGRKKYRRHLPMGFRANAVSVQLASTGTAKRKAYAVGFGYESESQP